MEQLHPWVHIVDDDLYTVRHCDQSSLLRSGGATPNAQLMAMPLGALRPRNASSQGAYG
jgi:hypothetical protein